MLHYYLRPSWDLLSSVPGRAAPIHTLLKLDFSQKSWLNDSSPRFCVRSRICWTKMSGCPGDLKTPLSVPDHKRSNGKMFFVMGVGHWALRIGHWLAPPLHRHRIPVQYCNIAIPPCYACMHGIRSVSLCLQVCENG